MAVSTIWRISRILPLFFAAEVVAGGERVFHSHGGFHRVLAVADQSQKADHVGRVALDDVFAAHIRVAGGNRVLDLLQRDSVALHAGGVGVDLIALDRPAEAADVGHARQAAERPLQREILQRLQIVQVVDLAAGRVLGVRQHVAEDLSRGRLRRDRRGDAGGQLRHLQAVEDLLPRSRLIDAVFELVADVAQLEHRLRLRVLQARHPRQGHLERNRDLAFHFFRRRAGIAGHDFHDCRGGIGIGLHVDVVEGIQAVAQQGEGQEQHDQAVLHRPTNQLLDHRKYER